jgi:hypothetical protein
VVYQASSISEALQIAEEFRHSGGANWFRGQTRNWPLLSSLGRRNESGREDAIQRINTFHTWLKGVSELRPIAKHVDATLAVAQHYGIPTNLIDFSTDPRVAAFFAAHDPPAARSNNDRGCIICLNTQELAEFWKAVSATRPELPEPRQVFVDIPELWRIQAQQGAFLYYPYDEGFERDWFGFDRIIFPLDEQPDDLTQFIPEEDIYPPQKSDLEILLDQYFMLERMTQGQIALGSKLGSSVNVIRYESLSDGIEAQCFGPAGLPPHESWNPSQIKPWIDPTPERWVALSSTPEIPVNWPVNIAPTGLTGSIAKQFEIAMAQDRQIRKSPVRWRMLGLPIGGHEAIEKSLSLLWDGLRRWPYSDVDVAVGMATAVRFGILVCQNPQARYVSNEADSIAIQCLGSAVEVETAMDDNSYSRGYASVEELFLAVRPDFSKYLADEWRSRITTIHAILQVATNPRHVFDFEALTRVFTRQIAPTEVVLRGAETGKARIYNPARIMRLGLP